MRVAAQILVHGEKHNMMRLKSKLLSLNHDKPTPTRIYSPANTEELRIPFRVDKTAKVVGRLAQTAPPKALTIRSSSGSVDHAEETAKKEATQQPQPSQVVSGVLVQRDFQLSLMAPADLREYAGLTTTTVRCRQRLTLHSAGRELIRWALQGAFGSIEELRDRSQEGTSEEGRQTNGEAETNGNGELEKAAKEEAMDGEVQRTTTTTFLVMGCVRVACAAHGAITVEWEGNALNDGLADAVLAVLFGVETSPASVIREQNWTHRSSRMLDANMWVDRILEAALSGPRPRPAAQPARRRHARAAPGALLHAARGAVRRRHHAHPPAQTARHHLQHRLRQHH